MSRVGVSAHELEGIQRLDKNRQLATYLRAQRANSKHYAAEGKAVVSAWSPLAMEDTANKRNIPRSPSPHPEVSAVGFDTPVLKPRTKLRKKEPTSQGGKREKQQKPERPNIPESPLERERASKSKTDRKSLPKNSTTTKRPAISTSDDEHEARLTERRERKRAKRAIVRSPDHPPDEAHEEEEPKNKSKRPKAKSKSKKEKAIPGFALMYGLNATNVGSNRLTMKPLINMGVFSKGKASAKTTAATTAKKGQSANLFSEIAFLNKSKQIHQQDNENEHSSSDDDEESLPNDHSTHTAKQQLGKKGLKPGVTKKPVKLRSRSPSSTSSSSDLSGQPLAKGKKCTKRAESIVWDIEREDASTLPTHSPTRDKASIVSGTIIVNARRLQNMNAYEYCKSKQTSSIDVDPEERTAEPDIDTASVSLHPSDSASQVKPQAPYQINTPVSRFFAIQPLPLDNHTSRNIARTGSPLSGNPADSQRLGAVPGPAPMEITDDNDISLSNSKGQTSYDNLPVDIAFPEVYDIEPFDVKAVHSGLSATQENAFGNVHLRPSVHPSVHLDFYEQLGEEDSLLCVDTLESPSIEIDAAATFYHMDPHRPYTKVPLWCSDFDEEASPVIYSLPLDSDDELTFLDSESMLFIEQSCQDYEDAHWEEESTTEYTVYGQELLADFEFDATLDDDPEYELDIAPGGGDYDYDDLPFGELSISNDNLDMDCEMLDEDVSDLSLAPTESSIAPQRFYQGRALLLGLSDPGVISPVVLRREAGSRPVSVAEKDVVRGLRGHWQPQRF
ncbi:hypothetical protein PC9H_005090 [Pleurotus ostreatus]|uniref:Uncharacterized protein n=1 Tax=Pleurotus ostreatus TaxID=5322 RepID=A0A8H6ZYY3_PLEOS|nr:uncharacterized protein PC9H_005090 [Pleurotus ostreatus]KAF7433141.1 hypothetical protein PC9H_005090 [Pleurotus ostreatus]